MAKFNFDYNQKIIVLADFRDKLGLQTTPPAGTSWEITGIDGLTDAVAPDGSGATVVSKGPGTFTATVKAPNLDDPTAPELTDSATVVMAPLPASSVTVSAVEAPPSGTPTGGGTGTPGEPATSVTVTATPAEGVTGDPDSV